MVTNLTPSESSCSATLPFISFLPAVLGIAQSQESVGPFGIFDHTCPSCGHGLSPPCSYTSLPTLQPAMVLKWARAGKLSCKVTQALTRVLRRPCSATSGSGWSWAEQQTGGAGPSGGLHKRKHMFLPGLRLMPGRPARLSSSESLMCACSVLQLVDSQAAFSKWWLAEFKTIKFPPQGTVFDYYIDPETKKFEPWSTLIPQFEFDPEVPLQVSV